MRFTLFGQGEGVLSDCKAEYWLTEQDGIVTDASVSARRKGACPGMYVRAAQALVPQIQVVESSAILTSVMKHVLNLLYDFSPWLATDQPNTFWAQIPGEVPPIREVRDILVKINNELTPEQRFRIGFAETPFSAKSLVLWSRLERVQFAQYYKVGSQQLMVSPVLHAWYANEHYKKSVMEWIREMPVQAIWSIPTSAKSTLMKLGISRVKEMYLIPVHQLYQHFGREALGWLQMFEPKLGGTLTVNYPFPVWKETWKPILGEESLQIDFSGILAGLIEKMIAKLERTSLGALTIGMRWRTRTKADGFERVAKRPVSTFDALLAELNPGIPVYLDESMEELELYVSDLKPLTLVQASLFIEDGLSKTDGTKERNLTRLLYHVNRKFPDGLKIGLRPAFRELRLQAILELAYGQR